MKILTLFFLFTGCTTTTITKPDGTVLYQRSCMDRSIKTWITDPMGNTLHDVRHNSILASEDFIRSLNII